MVFERLGHVMYRSRWQVLGLWAVLLVLALPFAPQAGSVLKGGGFSNGTSQADQATNALVSDLHFYASNLVVIFSSPTLTATDPRFRAAMQQALAPAPRLPDVASVETYYRHAALSDNQQFISNDGHSAIAILNYRVSYDVVQNLVPGVRSAIHSSRLRVLVAGDAAVFSDMQTVSKQDLSTVEKYTFPIALVLLVLIFGTLLSSLIPVITGGTAVAMTLALLFWLGHAMDLSIFALNVTSMIGLGVGIDYALFVVNRFREEIQHRSVEDAVAVTMAQAGRAVVFSGLTVMIGLSGLLIFHSMALRSIGLGGSMVVAVSVVAAITLLPALLAVIGTRIDRVKLVPWRVGGSGLFWQRLARTVMKRPWPVIVLVLLAVAAIASPFRSLRMTIPDARILPISVQSRQGYDLLNAQFNQQQNNPVIVVIQAKQGGILAPKTMGDLYDFVHTLARDPAVRPNGISSLVTLVPNATRADYLQVAKYRTVPAVAAAIATYTGNNTTFINIQPRSGLSESALENFVRRIRAMPLDPNLTRYVGGYSAGVKDYLNNLYAQFPMVIGVVVLITYIVLLLVLRSAILPLKAVLMNALSLLGAYGAVVFIFQEGHLSALLNFAPTGYIDEITPIIMFCTLFGLSMDYEVFLLSRMREQWLLSGDNVASVSLGLERTGRIITSAALILVVVAGSFTFTNIVLVKSVGLGLAIAILLDATLIRSLLVPATMRILGTWNWWTPPFLRPLIGDNTPTAPAPPHAPEHTARSVA